MSSVTTSHRHSYDRRAGDRPGNSAVELADDQIRQQKRHILRLAQFTVAYNVAEGAVAMPGLLVGGFSRRASDWSPTSIVSVAELRV